MAPDNELENIVDIGLDGAGCSGKSSGLTHIASKCADIGVIPIFVPEAARIYFQSLGFRESSLQVQKGIMTIQLANERFFREKSREWAVQYPRAPRILVMYDRTLLSGKGYVDQSIWEQAMKEMSLTEHQIASRYHAHIHMVTAADGAPTFYVNDAERLETPEQAIILDKKLRTIWHGLTEQSTIIANRGSFDQKMDDVWNAVLAAMGFPTMEGSERWFSVNDTFDPKMLPASTVRVYIEQDNLETERGEEWVRKKELANGKVMYFFAQKREADELGKKIERKAMITRKEYEFLLKRRSPRHATIRKHRYCFTHEFQHFELDHFLSPNPGFKFKLEARQSVVGQPIVFPEFLLVMDEVTGNPRYKNCQIALLSA